MSHTQSGYPEINASGNTISFAPFSPASRMAEQAFSTVFSLSRKIGESCAMAALNLFVIIYLLKGYCNYMINMLTLDNDLKLMGCNPRWSHPIRLLKTF